MRRLALSVVAAFFVLSVAGAAEPVRAQTPAQTYGPDGTPQMEPIAETQSYVEAPLSELLTHYWTVFYEVGQFPDYASVDQVKMSSLRKRLLDLRLVMDINAYAYLPEWLAAYRDAVDAAYELIGQYKDLQDIAALNGQPIDPTEQAIRQTKMNIAVAPFRDDNFREDMKKFFYNRAQQPLSLTGDDVPRLWQIAGVSPDMTLDSAGNVARLGTLVLRNLAARGLLVDNVLDPAQEAQFHDTRKAMRSVEVMVDMFPSLSAATTPFRDPLDAIVSEYGKVNDKSNALKAARASGIDVDKRAADLSDEYAKARKLADDFLSSGQLEAYASALEATQAKHRR